MGKRKGDDILVAGVSTVVSAEPTNANQSSISAFTTSTGFTGHSAPEWLNSASFDHKLRVVRESLKLDPLVSDEEDYFIREVNECHRQQEAFQRQQDQLLEQSQAQQEMLNSKIKEEQSHLQQELSALEAMENKLAEICKERDSIQHDISDLNRLREELETKISLAMEEANQEVENIDMVEEARKNQVPRLKHQISMYASTTGIKWDYGEGDILQGEAVRYHASCAIHCFSFLIQLWLLGNRHQTISSKEVIRSFRIDPHEYTRFEVAQMLWSVLNASDE